MIIVSYPKINIGGCLKYFKSDSRRKPVFGDLIFLEIEIEKRKKILESVDQCN